MSQENSIAVLSEELTATFLESGPAALRKKIKQAFPALADDACDAISRMVTMVSKRKARPRPDSRDYFDGSFVP